MKVPAKELERAARLYKGFREAAPRRAGEVRIKIPKVVMVMGHVNAIEYDTTHAGKTHIYRHRFAKGSRPILCAGTRDAQLYLVQGRYRVTARGIVDLDPNRREIDDSRKRR